MYTNEKCPWIGYKNPKNPDEGRIDAVTALVKIFGNYLRRHSYNFLSWLVTPEDEPDENSTYFERARHSWGSFFSQEAGGYFQANENEINRSFPRFGALWDFADGASKIDAVYTAEIEGKQIPIYLSTNRQKEPTSDELKKSIEFVRENRCSPYQDSGYKALSAFYRQEFDTPGLDTFLNEDNIHYSPDPIFARDYATRDEVGDITSRNAFGGIEDKSYTGITEGVRVRRFFRQWKPSMFVRWGLRNLAYDFLDYTIYSPLKMVAYAINKGPSSRTEDLVKRNYKGATEITRAFLGSGVTFDLRTEDEKKQVALRRKAA